MSEPSTITNCRHGHKNDILEALQIELASAGSAKRKAARAYYLRCAKSIGSADISIDQLEQESDEASRNHLAIWLRYKALLRRLDVQASISHSRD